ncbi:hypothetical protein EJF18_60398 [Clavispora lusitaniae]|uniref:Uncharacterized protein n=2 Tax=Clavispora lusitaniae TaxID=36911 RepID=C4Y9W1_CLAL4|nr:uncharacterized protein CLUG_05182 [Clavispora lusitaniae ATCC 42720]QFZ29884.1 hypothetical protein EJF14_60398 [Clavispora lusitaniae]EEQ41055.1 hypothetical protein CLUG_05182 [Clavispora lusitaniae ATCC 42720]QFZ35534.1 hypothetical protein EJF16_60398 [Clavispora lusitaniae]QFZ41228.1 hypothetical protein EJF15_60398 [Clavispora lusitaniae]QFZ46909.1 hypothetical protein EJF18_60398 [Clavispora lusitaniae]
MRSGGTLSSLPPAASTQHFDASRFFWWLFPSQKSAPHRQVCSTSRLLRFPPSPFPMPFPSCPRRSCAGSLFVWRSWSSMISRKHTSTQLSSSEDTCATCPCRHSCRQTQMELGKFPIRPFSAFSVAVAEISNINLPAPAVDVAAVHRSDPKAPNQRSKSQFFFVAGKRIKFGEIAHFDSFGPNKRPVVGLGVENPKCAYGAIILPHRFIKLDSGPYTFALVQFGNAPDKLHHTSSLALDVDHAAPSAHSDVSGLLLVFFLRSFLAVVIGRVETAQSSSFLPLQDRVGPFVVLLL